MTIVSHVRSRSAPDPIVPLSWVPNGGMRVSAGPPLAEIVASAAAGDERSWEALVGEFSTLVLSTCRRHHLP